MSTKLSTFAKLSKRAGPEIDRLAADLGSIEKAANIPSPNPLIRKELPKFARRWRNKARNDPEASTPAAYVRALNGLRSDSLRLLQRLGGKSALTAATEDAVLVVLGSGKQESLIETLSGIVETAEIEVENATRGRGRLPESHFRLALEELIAIYETTTSRKAGVSNSGPFFRFVREVLKLLAPGLSRQDAALGKAIQRHVAVRRRASSR